MRRRGRTRLRHFKEAATRLVNDLGMCGRGARFFFFLKDDARDLGGEGKGGGTGERVVSQTRPWEGDRCQVCHWPSLTPDDSGAVVTPGF
ncbi:hypothetical protein CEXT_790881 [Caerostris extrusa]|uniref:Uncharacterized protein n=1 Tax=Caerostris extrusa TaxID=172846 RepID=A0AAV4NIM9_CAEEX|nr:hypothetical protein CEXT_790881 [Caerostris extrusa]